MKKGLSILLCACLLFGLCACTGQNGAKSKETTTVSTTASTTKKPESTTKKRKTDFRNVCWGDSAARVKKEETAKFITDGSDDTVGNMLCYEATIAGENTNLTYCFDKNDELYRVLFDCTTKYTSFGQWKNCYDNLKKSLTTKYGKPDTSTVVNNVDQNLIDAAGSQALEYGYVSYIADWKTNRTNIRLALMSQEYKVFCSVLLTDKNHKDDPNDSGL